MFQDSVPDGSYNDPFLSSVRFAVEIRSYTHGTDTTHLYSRSWTSHVDQTTEGAEAFFVWPRDPEAIAIAIELQLGWTFIAL